MSFLKYLQEWESMKKKLPISPSTLLGLKVTLKATLEILDMLHENNDYDYLMTATLSQDPLERFFSVIRFSCGSNDHPDPKLFGQVYRLLSSFSLIRPPKGCNVTGTELLKSLMEAKDSLKVSNECRELWLQKLDDLLDGDLPLEQSITSEEDHDYNEAVTSQEVQSYIAGYIVRKFKKIVKCNRCIETLQMDRDKGKELNRNDVVNKMDLYGGLLYASNEVFILTKQLEECVLRVISKSKINIDIIDDIYTEMAKKKKSTDSWMLRTYQRNNQKSY
ncbi:uncharacterized protein LOC123268196 [Cotesia glomerata]|uniref:uncharacterized protein LOC123268196 n=1 Tax=Cotesia glomerata TaxID=32391 RepID=UPI001D01B6F4|nr:uncharacterized protein LOC123268196 [Cotesia glomerata]